MACDIARYCQSNRCEHVKAGYRVCIPVNGLNDEAKCWEGVHKQCSSGRCEDIASYWSVCIPKHGLANGRQCWNGRHHLCASNFCQDHKCRDKFADTAACSHGSQCQSGRCEHVKAGYSICIPKKGLNGEPVLVEQAFSVRFWQVLRRCLQLCCLHPEVGSANGRTCWSGKNYQCKSGLCKDSKCINKIADNQACSHGSQCQSGRCEHVKAEYSICIPKKGLNDENRCWSNKHSQCASGKCYDVAHSYAVCIPKSGLANGRTCWSGKNYQCKSGLCKYSKCMDHKNDYSSCHSKEECKSTGANISKRTGAYAFRKPV